MANQLEQVLRDVGPCLSSIAAAELRKRFGLSEAAARQRIARREYPVQRLDLPFKRGAAFLYLPQQNKTGQFVRALADALEANNGAYARTLQALGARGGIMPMTHLPAAAGLSESSGQLCAEDVIMRLVHAEVLEEVDVPGLGPCIALTATAAVDEPMHSMKARLIAETILLNAVKQWARNLALGSYESFNLRGDAKPPTVGRFQWDLTAPSYIAGLSTWDAKSQKPKPGFIVADVLLGRTSVDERDLRPFLYKSQTLRQTNPARCMQIFLAEGFTREALMQLRRHGIVPGTVDELFGRNVAEALKLLISTLTQTAATAVDPAKFDQLFAGLGRFEAAAGTLRGALFEFVSAAVLSEDGWHDVIINKVYRQGGKDLAEVDVRGRRGKDILFVECKGIMPGTTLDDEEVKTWLEKRIPAVLARTLENEEFRNCKLKFELWTTGALSDAALAMIAAKQASVRPSKYTIEIRLGPSIKSMAEQHKGRQPALVQVLQQHFLTSPLLEARQVLPGSSGDSTGTGVLAGLIPHPSKSAPSASSEAEVLALPAPVDSPNP